MNDLKSWLDAKGYLSEDVSRISTKLGDGYLIESLISDAQRAEFEALENPPKNAKILKDGSRSFVCAADISDKVFALKFYYRLSLRRRLGYSIWKSRAMRAWIASRAFTKIGIKTPKAVMLVERTKAGLLYDSSLFVTKMAKGTPLLDFVANHAEDAESLKKVAANASEIFANFEKFRIYHGDTNPKNFIVAPDLSLSVLDLDAVEFDVSSTKWDTKRSKDLKKFARLWSHQPSLEAIFVEFFDNFS